MSLSAEKRCSACGGTMECKRTNFSIGTDGNGGLFGLFASDLVDVDLYLCPRCGKIDLYALNFQPQTEEKDSETTAASAEETVTCPICGTQHSSLIGCPTCVSNQYIPSGASLGSPNPKKPKAHKPPWEK